MLERLVWQARLVLDSTILDSTVLFFLSLLNTSVGLHFQRGQMSTSRPRPGPPRVRLDYALVFVCSAASKLTMVCCSCERVIRWSSVLLVTGALFVGGVRFWLKEKSYVFSADKVASLTNEVLHKSIGTYVPYNT